MGSVVTGTHRNGHEKLHMWDLKVSNSKISLIRISYKKRRGWVFLRCSLIFTVETWLLWCPSWYGIHTAVICTFHLSFLMAFQWQWRLDMLQKAFREKMYLCTDLKCQSFFRNKSIWNSQTRKVYVWNEKSAKLSVLSVRLTKSRIFCKTMEQSYVEMDANPFYYTLWHRTLSSGDKNTVAIHC